MCASRKKVESNNKISLRVPETPKKKIYYLLHELLKTCQMSLQFFYAHNSIFAKVDASHDDSIWKNVNKGHF